MNFKSNKHIEVGSKVMNCEEEEFYLALGKRLMLLRLSKKMSRAYLGARIGVRGQQILKYETGENKITPERLKLCAEIFGVSVSFLFGEEEFETPESIDRTVLTAAAELGELPPEIRQSVYALSRIINKVWEGKEGGIENRETKHCQAA